MYSSPPRYSRFAEFEKKRRRKRAGMLSKLVGRSTKGRLVRAAALAGALTGAGAIAARRKGISAPHSKMRRGLLKRDPFTIDVDPWD